MAENVGGGHPEGPTARFTAAIRCPACRGELSEARVCAGCGAEHPVEGGVHRLVSFEAANSASAVFYNAPEQGQYGRGVAEMPETLAAPVRSFLASQNENALVLEIGAGRGAFAANLPGYVALDLSFPALRALPVGPRVQADAMALPFADGSIDAVFTVACLEHVPHPERALAEIDRVLRRGGRALVYPAWYVRPWTAKGLAKRPFSGLGWADRARKLTIPIRDRREYQFGRVLPARIARELGVLTRRPCRFGYRRLKPNLDEYITSDSDAFTSMDPHAAAAYFVSRDYADLNRSRAVRRLLYGYEPVIVEKP